MPQSVTLREAEAIRARFGYDPYTFSVKIGLSPTAYVQAQKRRKIGKHMAFRIAMHYARILSEMRSGEGDA
jgi:hypothetical protein